MEKMINNSQVENAVMEKMIQESGGGECCDAENDVEENILGIEDPM